MLFIFLFASVRQLNKCFIDRGIRKESINKSTNVNKIKNRDDD